MQAAPAASSSTGESGAVCTGEQPGLTIPLPEAPFHIGGNRGTEKRLCITRRGKHQVSCIKGQCPSPHPGGGPEDGDGQGLTQCQKSLLARAEDMANCGSRSAMSPMGKQQPFRAAWDGALLDPLGASPGSGPTLWGCVCSKGCPTGRKGGEKLRFSSAGLWEPKL